MSGMILLADGIGWNWTLTISSPDIVDKHLNHGASSPTPTHSLSHSDQIVAMYRELHRLDSWQFGQQQVNLQHILHPLVVIIAPSRLYSMEEYLTLAPALMDTNHGVHYLTNPLLLLTREPISSLSSPTVPILTHHVQVHLRCQQILIINREIAVSFLNLVICI